MITDPADTRRALHNRPTVGPLHARAVRGHPPTSRYEVPPGDTIPLPITFRIGMPGEGQPPRGPHRILVIQPSPWAPRAGEEGCEAVLDTGNGGHEVHEPSFRRSLETLLRDRGLRPTSREVDLCCYGLGGQERRALREFTFVQDV